MKKLAMLLAVLMLAVAAFSVSAFEDVTFDDACFDAVNTLTSLEVIKGKTETTFAPNDPVTREQMAMLFTRLYTTVNFENGDNMTPFTDLDDPYYNSVIAWCYDAKVINGTSPVTFEPKAHIIFQDALTMACRLLGYTDLSYPFGNITKARQLGLTDGLEGTAYDKELTRGEVAIILYNALEADGAEIVKELMSEYAGVYPFPVYDERNFKIAVDVYNFKKETYQIVGTDNFSLEGYSQSDADSYNLMQINTVTGEYAKDAKAIDMKFDKIAVAEGTDGDDNILAYIEILYRGDKLDDKKAVVLSSTIMSDLDSSAELGVYFKKNGDKMEAQTKNIVVDGKVYTLSDENKMVYTIDANGIIAPLADQDISKIEVFYQTSQDAQGVYAQKIVDVNMDDTPDYIMIFPMSFVKYDGATTNVINEASAKKNDYVLTYKYGKYTVIDSVVEPIVAGVVKKAGVGANEKFTLSTGDVVSLATKNDPVINETLPAAPTLTVKEISLYIVNDKILKHEGIVTPETYKPYSYALYVQDNGRETNVDENGITYVDTILAFMGGKVVTLPVTDTATNLGLGRTAQMITITGTKDGKYLVKAGVESVGEKYEIKFDDAILKYDSTFNVYRLIAGGKTYIVEFNEKTEFYEETAKGGYKCYTMANFPQLADTTLTDAIITPVKNASGKVVGYDLVVAHTKALKMPSNATSDSEKYQDYRIVLDRSLGVNAKNEQFNYYTVLNPFTGAIEEMTDTTTSGFEAGAVIRKMTNKNDLVQVSAENEVETSSTDKSKKPMQIDSIVANDTIINVRVGASLKEIKATAVKIVVLDYNADNELTVNVIDDIHKLEGKVVRTYVKDYKPEYMVVVPYEWAKAAGFTDLAAYPESK